jgi:hypothetical protein
MNFIPIPGRDAYATFAGYLYQVNVTILRWLNLGPNTALELEAGEDIDTVRMGSDGRHLDVDRVFEQLKQLAGSLTLRSGDALEGIANFCELRRLNPDAKLVFRFLTTATIGREQTPWRNQRRGIELWEAVRCDHFTALDRIMALEELRSFLRHCKNTGSASVSARSAFQDVLDSVDIEAFGSLVGNFEWATGSGNHEEVEEEICAFLMGA